MLLTFHEQIGRPFTLEDMLTAPTLGMGLGIFVWVGNFLNKFPDRLFTPKLMLSLLPGTFDLCAWSTPAIDHRNGVSICGEYRLSAMQKLYCFGGLYLLRRICTGLYFECGRYLHSDSHTCETDIYFKVFLIINDMVICNATVVESLTLIIDRLSFMRDQLQSHPCGLLVAS